jgi:hypothetical protein
VRAQRRGGSDQQAEAENRAAMRVDAACRTAHRRFRIDAERLQARKAAPSAPACAIAGK